jgi:hypothetical protein
MAVKNLNGAVALVTEWDKSAMPYPKPPKSEARQYRPVRWLIDRRLGEIDKCGCGAAIAVSVASFSCNSSKTI